MSVIVVNLYYCYHVTINAFREITFKFRGLGLFLISLVLVFSVIFLVVPRARANVMKICLK